jgi:hypothetical protein
MFADERSFRAQMTDEHAPMPLLAAGEAADRDAFEEARTSAIPGMIRSVHPSRHRPRECARRTRC